ncbi:hypothetical protein Y032_0079g1236 [Ancylostoma ceylanicum]|uniref:CCHC-type domain-containing protein n=1 Tax=Ancylostoma ceylanicum TaxID=53326 RepID=A0A016TSV9_9BILA|nr:hypothetical protein Y032_0079g1236 [Ancylostoma ceylanicum]
MSAVPVSVVDAVANRQAEEAVNNTEPPLQAVKPPTNKAAVKKPDAIDEAPNREPYYPSMPSPPVLSGSWAEEMARELPVLDRENETVPTADTAEVQSSSTVIQNRIYKKGRRAKKTEVSQNESVEKPKSVERQVSKKNASEKKTVTVLKEPLSVKDSSQSNLASFQRWVEIKQTKSLETQRKIDEKTEKDLLKTLSNWKGLNSVSGTKGENSSKSVTIRPNPSPSDTGILPKIPQPNTYDAEHRTTEELTATQLRQVIAYLDSSYFNFVRTQACQDITIPSNQSVAEVKSVIRIAKSVKQLHRLTENLVNIFRRLAVFTSEADPSKVSFALVSAWIDELTHGIVSVSVHRDCIQEEMLPMLLASPEVIRTTQSQLEHLNINQSVLNELLQASSLACAFAHRYIRTLQTFQLTQSFRWSDAPVCSLDTDYQWGERQKRMTDVFPDPSSFYAHLQAWRNTFSKELGITAANRRLAEYRTSQVGVDQGSQTEDSTNRTARNPQAPPQPSAPQPGPERSTLRNNVERGNPSNNNRQRSPRAVEVNRSRKRRQSVNDEEQRHQKPRLELSAPPLKYSGCVFCSDRGHYSTECPNVWRLSLRRNVIYSESLCHKCLKRHLGECKLDRKCAICKSRSHHQALCVRNRYAACDIRQPAVEFYEDLAQRPSVRLPQRADREPVAEEQIQHNPRVSGDEEESEPPYDDDDRDEGLW